MITKNGKMILKNVMRIVKQVINLFNKKMAESEVQELIIEAHRDLFSPHERGFISDSLKIAFSIQP